MRKQNYINYAYVVADIVASGNVPAAGSVVTPANLANGAAAITDLGNRVLDNTAYAALPATGQFKVVKSRGASYPLVQSPVLTKGLCTITSQKHLVAREQITYVGYNLTTGTGLPVINDGFHFLTINKLDNDEGNRSNSNPISPNFTADGTATQQEVAFGLAANAYKVFKNQPDGRYLRVEVVSNGTVTGSGETATVTQDSKTVTFGGNVTIATGALVALAGSTYEVETGVTTGTTITLAMPYQGASGTITSGTTYATNNGVLSAVTVFGLRLRGVSSSFDVEALRNYYKHRFSVSYDINTSANTSFTPALISTTQTAFEGVGTWQKVAFDEYMSFGFDGFRRQTGTFTQSRPQTAVENAEYSVVDIAFTETTSVLGSVDNFKGNVLIYAALDSSSNLPNTTAAGALVTALGITSTDLDK